MTQATEPSHVAVLGAGPVGLEAAAAALGRGLSVVVFERGDVAEHVRDWGHVEMFTPFGMNVGSAGKAQLDSAGASLPGEDDMLEGRAFRDRYLLPLADALEGRVTFERSARVVAVGRTHLLKREAIGAARRGDDGFRILYERDGREYVHTARVVFDCSGTFATPAWMGPGGTPAIGERRWRRAIAYRIPDILGDERWHYDVRRTLVVGSGHSAATSVLMLATVAAADDGTRVHWVTRRETPTPIPSIPDDPLAARARLTERANALALSPPEYLAWESGVHVTAIARQGENDPFSVTLRGKYGTRTEEFDRIIANVGFEPDDSVYRQLQIHECYASRAPMKLASALVAASGDTPADCLELGGFGPEVLQNPEVNYFILGSKSYGTHSAFLLMTGYEQVHDAFGLLDRAGGVRQPAGLSLLK